MPSFPRLLPRPALLAALALAALPAAGAHAATVGVNISDIPDQPQELDALAASGARYVRVFVPWAQVEPTPGARNLLPQYRAAVGGAADRGMKLVFVITTSPSWASGSQAPRTPPRDPADFARFARDFATEMAAAGGAGAYEVWNEEDETLFWAGAPEPARYVALLKAAYAALKAGDPGAKVVLGPLTGNNYAFLQQLYDNGAKGAFDAVGVHTDTACLVDPPDRFYREDGRVARFTFLGIRSVRETMLANGDDKPIWMTELGWSTSRQTCSRGVWAGQKLAGVTEAEQAANLKLAYHCLAGYPYVEVGLWFTWIDPTASGAELDSYGLHRVDGSRRPAFDAFRTVATRGDTLSGPCGDFDPPAIAVRRPSPNLRYSEALAIEAVAEDPGGVARVTFQADGQELRNFTGADVGSGRPVSLEWQGSKRLSYGRHTITVVALDPQGNASTQSVDVVRVDPRRLGMRLRTVVKLGKLRRKGRVASIGGRVRKTGELGLNGKVRVAWQQRRGKRWRTIHGALKNANRPFRFRQRLKRAGRWRVQVRYLGKAPYRPATAVTKAFRVR